MNSIGHAYTPPRSVAAAPHGGARPRSSFPMLDTQRQRPAVITAVPNTPKQQLLAKFTENLQLPRPPAIVLRVLERASQPDCSVNELTDIAHLDPVLCGKFLQTVNSAA